MTTVSNGTSALTSLLSLYTSENRAKSGAETGDSLTGSQVGGLVGTIDGDATSTSGVDALLGSATATGSTDLGSILDEIQAQKSARATASDASGTATTQQQKAAALMQSVYQTQQSNLFTLLG